MSENIVDHSYNADDIQVLEGLEAVRKRPGMYIASTSIKGLHHLVWEIVDNSIDEALAGFADKITVEIEEGNIVKVTDNGRGMPVEVHKKTGISTVETIFTVLHAGGKFGGGAYKVSGGLHGVGASVVNALSAWLEVYVRRDGHIYYCRFENGGKTTIPLKMVGDCDPMEHGSVVRFLADPTIFEETVYDHKTLRDRIRELAFLNKGISIDFIDNRNELDEKGEPVNRNEPEHHFCYEGGISEYVAFLNTNKTPLHENVIYVEGKNEKNNISVEVGLQYNDGYHEDIYTFCNNINTVEGGTHEEGFSLALNRIINRYARNNNYIKKDEANFTTDDIKEGMTAVISVKHPDPQYEGQTKTKLGNSEVKGVVSDIFGSGL